MYNIYKSLIDMETTLYGLDALVECIAYDDSITNEEYNKLYDYAVAKVQKGDWA